MGSRRGRLTMYSSYSYGGSSYGGGLSYSGSSYSYGGSYASPSYGPTAQTSRYRDMVSNMYGGLPTPNSGYSSKYTSQYSPSTNSALVSLSSLFWSPLWNISAITVAMSTLPESAPISMKNAIMLRSSSMLMVPLPSSSKRLKMPSKLSSVLPSQNK